MTEVRHDRKSIRLPEYDYSGPGRYFVTVCTADRRCLFGAVAGERMTLNEYGLLVETCWRAIPEHFAHIELDDFVVMPDHVHGIVGIVEPVGATHGSPPGTARGPMRRSLGAIVGTFKTAVGQRINRLRGTAGTAVWQRGYYEHIIRNEQALDAIRRYIAENPLRWGEDGENPDVIRRRGL
jgi:REP element-mobilizing transposase RayT